MQQQDMNREELIAFIEEMPAEDVADVAGCVQKTHVQKTRRSGQGLDARGQELIWRCTECGHIIEKAVQLPDDCPSCGSHKEAFVLVEED